MSPAAEPLPGRRPPSRRSTYLCVLAAACLWGTIGTAYHLLRAVAEVDALTVVTIRATAAAVLLWGWLALTDRSALLDVPRPPR